MTKVYNVDNIQVEDLYYNANHLQIKSIDALCGVNEFAYDKDYNEREQLTYTQEEQQDGEIKLTAFAYDNNGNMLSRLSMVSSPISNEDSVDQETGTGGAVLYEYDAFNRLRKAIDGGMESIHTYYPDGQRAAQTTGNETHRYFYEGDKIVLETDSNGTQTARNVYGINLLSWETEGQSLSYLYNGHADVTALVDIL